MPGIALAPAPDLSLALDATSCDTWLEVALERLRSDDACSADPQAAVATFNSAF